MFEWWEALALSAATLMLGGLIAVGSSYLQRVWTKSDARAASDRDASRRHSEEERQARRRYRQRRIQPLVDFVDLARQEFADDRVRTILGQLNLTRLRGDKPSGNLDTKKVQAFYNALAACPQEDIQDGLIAVFAALQKGDSDPVAGLKAISKLETLIEVYLVEV